MKKIQRFLRGTALLAVLSLLVSATAFAASVPDPTSDFYVNDYVGVLSGDTKSDIVSKNDGLYNATGAQIVVTVVQDTGGVSMEQYAYDMANAWGIGSAEKNNGVLLLLSVGDDDYQCIQGSGLETLLLPADPAYIYLSSTVAREMIHYHQPLDKYLPKAILPLIRDWTEQR